MIKVLIWHVNYKSNVTSQFEINSLSQRQIFFFFFFLPYFAWNLTQLDNHHSLQLQCVSLFSNQTALTAKGNTNNK